MPDFSLDAAPQQEGGFVVRSGLIFRCGTYEDKDFSLTPEEAAAAVCAFQPVDIDLEHRNTVLSGKLGKVRKIWLQGEDVYGEAALPSWFDAQLEAEGRKVSCAWNRETKTLDGLGIVLNPRVPDAALMSAYFAAEMGLTDEERDKIDPKWFAGPDDTFPIDTPAHLESACKLYGKAADPEAVKAKIKRLAKEQGWESHLPDDWKEADMSAIFEKPMTPHGQQRLQQIHDCAAEGGALCTKPDKADMTASHERSALQDIHDTACKHGASCPGLHANYDNDQQARHRAGEGKATMSNWANNLLNSLRGKGVISEEEAAQFSQEVPEPVTAPATVKFADTPEYAEFKANQERDRATIAAQAAALEAQRTVTAEIQATFAAQKVQAQFGIDCERLKNLKRQLKMTPDEADQWEQIAKDSPAAFAAAIPVLEARIPLPQLARGTQDSTVRAEMEADPDGLQLTNKAKAYAKEHGCEFHVAFSAVCRENPGLATAYRATMQEGN